MQVVLMVLALLLAVIVSSSIARLSPLKLPLPLIEIAVGAGLWYAAGFHIRLSPDVFFLLFIPPLLFLDGWRIPKGAFFRELRPILMLAIGLVIFTVVGMGPLIDWMIPAIPLSVAFALAAILSPTDPVAVSAIVSNAPIPTRLMHILEGEALLNDASGLVCFRFAVAAALTGQFSLGHASWSFLVLTGGGVIVGAAVVWGVALVNWLIIRRTGEESGIQILISLLIPFAAYLVGEHLNVSGILAAATAGIAMPYTDRLERPMATTRLRRGVVWDTVQMALNGTIFVLLGQQLPHILVGISLIARQAHIGNPWLLVGYIFAITVSMMLLRFVWAWASLLLTLYRNRGRQSGPPASFIRVLSATAFSGVRGAVTLAGILTLPLLMPDGSAFPARDLAILLAMGVILLSLVMASIALPLLAKGLELSPNMSSSIIEQETNARSAAADAAIRRLEQLREKSPELKDYSDEVERTINLYRRQSENKNADSEDAKRAQMSFETSRRLRIEALRAERDELYRLRRSHKINDALLQKLVREIDLVEASLLG